LQPGRALCFRLGKTQGQETAGPRFSAEEENPASVHVRWNRRSRLAHVSPHGRNHARRDGRASTDYPRLSASQKSSCNQQIFADDMEDEAVGTGKTGRGDNAADRISAETNSRSMIAVGREKHSGRLLFAYRSLISPDLVKVRAASA